MISIHMSAYIIRYFLDSVPLIPFLIRLRMNYVWYDHKHGYLPENVHLRIGGGTTTDFMNVDIHCDFFDVDIGYRNSIVLRNECTT